VADCDTPCAGDLTENCGGHNHLNLYDFATLIAPPANPTAPTIIGTYNLVGCQTDGASYVRALNALATAGPTMTNEVCEQFCAGYVYFGTEYGDECKSMLLINSGYNLIRFRLL
jgi:hypothetical protein